MTLSTAIPPERGGNIAGAVCRRLAKGLQPLATRIYLTGRIFVEHEGALAFDEAALPGRQGRLVFAYLATNLHRTVSRAELTDVLWGDSPPRGAEMTLSAVLSRLRSLL